MIDGCVKPRYQQSRYSSHGYQKQSAEGHQLADAQGSVYVHRLVLFEAIGVGPHPCWWCGMLLEWRPFDGRSWSGVLVVDHLDGDASNNVASNLVPSCFSCNVHRARSGNAAFVAAKGARAVDPVTA